MPLEKGCWVSVPETSGGNGAGILCFSGHMRPGWAWERADSRTIICQLCLALLLQAHPEHRAIPPGWAWPCHAPCTLSLPLLSAPQPVHCQLVREPSSACLCPDEGRTSSLMATLYAQCSEEISVEKLLGRGGALGWWGSVCIPSDSIQGCTPVSPRLLEVDVPETM